MDGYHTVACRFLIARDRRRRGPGYATIDLAEIVGPTGEVIAVERSPRFVAVIEEEARRRGLSNARVHQKDLMTGPLERE